MSWRTSGIYNRSDREATTLKASVSGHPKSALDLASLSPQSLNIQCANLLRLGSGERLPERPGGTHIIELWKCTGDTAVGSGRDRFS